MLIRPLAICSTVFVLASCNTTGQEFSTSPNPAKAPSVAKLRPSEVALLCDAAAAHPKDNQGSGAVRGVAFERQIDVPTALAACAAAIKENPREPRFQFQYGRALLAQGNTDQARARFVAAASQGHQLSRAYLQNVQPQPDTRIARPAPQRPARPNPHENFEKEIGGVIEFFGGLVALDSAISAANAGDRAQSIPSSSSRQQCAAITQNNAIKCSYEVAELTSAAATYNYQCFSKFTAENRACLPRFNAPTANAFDQPDYYCDPATGERAPTVAQLVGKQCGNKVD